MPLQRLQIQINCNKCIRWWSFIRISEEFRTKKAYISFVSRVFTSWYFYWKCLKLKCNHFFHSDYFVPYQGQIKAATITANALLHGEQRLVRRYSLYEETGNSHLRYKVPDLINFIEFDAYLNTIRIENVELLRDRHPDLFKTIPKILKRINRVLRPDFFNK